jgi:hypothetical protein
MTTVNDWINRALRLAGALGGGIVATGQEAADGLEAANGLILGLPEIGAAAPLREVIITADYTAGEDERVVNSGGYVVTLPDTIQEGGATRTPRNGARVVVVTGDAAVTHLYLVNSGWHQVSGLAITDPAPLGPEFYTGLCAILAVHLAPEYDQTPSETVVALATAGRLAIASQFWKAVEVSAAPEFYVMSDMGFPGDPGWMQT